MRGLGRSTQFKDRWVGNFILVFVAVIAAAYFIGSLLNPRTDEVAQEPPLGEQPWTSAPQIQEPQLGGQPQAPQVGQLPAVGTAGPGDHLYFVQVTAISDPMKAHDFARSLMAKGLSAWVTSEAPYRIHVGAYASRQKADEAAQRVEAMQIPGLTETPPFISSVPMTEITLPAAAGIDANQQAALQAGMAAVTGYLKEAASWIEGHESAQVLPTDKLSEHSAAVQEALAQLANHSSDPSVYQFIELAALVKENHDAIRATEVGQINHEALQTYLELAGTYREKMGH